MGVSYHTLPNQKDGTLALDAIEAAIRPDDNHCPRTKLVCLENTQNSCGGVVLPLEYVNAVEQLCRHHNLKFHLDGACVESPHDAGDVALKNATRFFLGRGNRCSHHERGGGQQAAASGGGKAV